MPSSWFAPLFFNETQKQITLKRINWPKQELDWKWKQENET